MRSYVSTIQILDQIDVFELFTSVVTVHNACDGAFFEKHDIPRQSAGFVREHVFHLRII